MKISILTCTQRPIDMSRYAISQAKYMSIYNIIGEDDLKALDSYMEVPLLHYIAPSKVKNSVLIEGKRLKQYEHLYYDVAEGKAVVMPPIKMTVNTRFEEQKSVLPVKKIALAALAATVLKVIL